ncbi:hypothetical protein ARMSODRAFT_947655 [Armillaria solidipes]|uniref:Uncharacterized protein n=1 Tax=Armillaria solidipes TaxID=1076256 RepID=A0A2H3CTQ1_9AGAR|nr:hypothetical protein ARMSODRAFT_947655 [Armillaria solidipes]
MKRPSSEFLSERFVSVNASLPTPTPTPFKTLKGNRIYACKNNIFYRNRTGDTRPKPMPSTSYLLTKR